MWMLISPCHLRCPPCRRIAPIYEEMASQFPTITFTKVNVDMSRGMNKVASVYFSVVCESRRERCENRSRDPPSILYYSPDHKHNFFESFKKLLFYEISPPSKVARNSVTAKRTSLASEFAAQTKSIKPLSWSPITDIAGRYGIRAMPTFIVLWGGQEVERVQGADPNRYSILFIFKSWERPRYGEAYVIHLLIL